MVRFINLAGHTEKTILPIPFTLNGIWSWWQFSFRFWIKWNSIWFRKLKWKTVKPRPYPIQFGRKWKYSFLSPGPVDAFTLLLPRWRDTLHSDAKSALCDWWPSLSPQMAWQAGMPGISICPIVWQASMPGIVIWQAGMPGISICQAGMPGIAICSIACPSKYARYLNMPHCMTSRYAGLLNMPHCMTSKYARHLNDAHVVRGLIKLGQGKKYGAKKITWIRILWYMDSWNILERPLCFCSTV